MKASRKIKNAHKADGRFLSLREFALELKAKGDEVAIAWFANKSATAESKEKSARRERKAKVLSEMRAAKRAIQDKNKKR